MCPPRPANKKSVNFRIWLFPRSLANGLYGPNATLSVGPSTESEKVQSSVQMSQTHSSNAYGMATYPVSQGQLGSLQWLDKNSS